RHRWIINGQPVRNQDSGQLSPELLKRGDSLSVEIWPHDGVVEGLPFTAGPFVVVNSPPVVSRLAIEPESVFSGAPVQAIVDVSDAAIDVIQVSYRWLKNDVLIKDGEERELDAAEFSRGDTLSVEAVPFDGVKRGHTVRLGPIHVGNSPPRIMSAP